MQAAMATSLTLERSFLLKLKALQEQVETNARLSLICEGQETTGEPSIFPPGCLSMHLTRPKSSKGRSRPAVNGSLCTGDADGVQRPERNLRSRSQPTMRQAGQLSHHGVPRMLRGVPAAPLQSLNKYRVLPSIETGPSERSLRKQALGRAGDAVLQQRPVDPGLPDVIRTGGSEVGKGAGVHLGVCPEPPEPGTVTPGDPTGSLLLAIRAPCGGRFQQRFDPTDTLLTVRASAEVRYGASYGDASIETTEVPRRSFTAMEKTLAQCGILNRSVLRISHHGRVAERE